MEFIICISIICVTVIIMFIIHTIYDYKKSVTILKNDYGEQVNHINNSINHLYDLLTTQNIVLVELKDKLKNKIKEDGKSI